MSLGILQVHVSNLEQGVVTVMIDKMTQSSAVCKTVCLDLKCIENLRWVALFTLLMTFMDVCVWIIVYLKHLSVMKCNWETLSNNIMQGTYWPDFFWIQQLLLRVECDFWVCLWMKIRVNICSWVALCICRWTISFWNLDNFTDFACLYLTRYDVSCDITGTITLKMCDT